MTLIDPLREVHKSETRPATGRECEVLMKDHKQTASSGDIKEMSHQKAGNLGDCAVALTYKINFVRLTPLILSRPLGKSSCCQRPFGWRHAHRSKVGSVSSPSIRQRRRCSAIYLDVTVETLANGGYAQSPLAMMRGCRCTVSGAWKIIGVAPSRTARR